ncbi:hypothetical protein MVEN_01380200 [Mycena venus]|uniref:Uncharacterized protein n=1 Tax=Mycena venus TaxID=2733690 RepID=A0A8H6XYI5_9AGAR|nr:hypothetical protein MVEN_01380200 [Mycena venus]
MSHRERVEAKIAANPALGDMFSKGFDGTYHFKILTQPTLDQHQVLRNKWRDFVDYHENPALPAEIEPGSLFPALTDAKDGTLKSFILYLAAGSRGLISGNITYNSIRHYLCTFFVCWARYANVHVTTAVRHQAFAFARSSDVLDIAPLSKEVRSKPTATIFDLDAVIRFVWNDKKIFKTLRSKVQFNAINLMGDITFAMIPNSETPNSPLCAAGIRLRNKKKNRDDPAYFRTVWIVMEPFGLRAHCLVTLLLYLAILDGVFADCQTIEQVLYPEHAPTKTHHLRIKEECNLLPAFRGDILDAEGNWITDPTQALQAHRHNGLLHQTTFAMGFIILFSFYIWRRSAANAFHKSLTDTERDGLLTHDPKSNMYARAYHSRVTTYDLGGILHERGQDATAVETAQAASSLSVGRDDKAPKQLTVQERAALEREPELIKMRETIVAYKELVASTRREIKSVYPDDADADETIAGLHGQLRMQLKQHREFRAKYEYCFFREYKARLKLSRKAFFEDGSRRQLAGEAPPAETPLQGARAPLADKTRQQSVPVKPRVVVGGKENTAIVSKFLADADAVDPQTRLCDVLYFFAVPDISAETAAAVNALLGCPPRRFPACYPGESPTEDEKCPVCKRDCRAAAFRGSTTPGSHIHACLLDAQQKRAQKHLEDEFQPQQCTWKTCKARKNGVIFKKREDFVAHVANHGASLHKGPSANYPDGRRTCEFLIGEDICDEDDLEDFNKHCGQCHGINVHEHVKVTYCVLCTMWFVDDQGDGLAWEGHLCGHFDELYAPFSTRIEDDNLDLKPIGVEFTTPLENAVDFSPGSGFGGALPEFHGECSHGIALVPMHCPFCVFDETLPPRGQNVSKHDNELAETGNPCPVPSCGTRKYSQFDLETHLVAYHRLPMCGSTNHTKIRRLLLPPVPIIEPVKPVDLAHLDDDDAPTAPAPAPASKLRQLTEHQAGLEQRRAQKKAAKADAAESGVVAWCFGCSRTKQDIGKHLTDTKCRKRNEYQLVVDGKRVGERLEWDITEPLPAKLGRNERKTHLCVSCRRQFHNILDHKNPTHADFDTTCTGTKFSIIKSGTRRESGPHLDINEWRNTKACSFSLDKLPFADYSRRRRGKLSSPTPSYDRGEGSSALSKKRKRRLVIESSEEEDAGDDKAEDRGEGSSKQPIHSQRAIDLNQPAVPAEVQFMCNSCAQQYVDVDSLAEHFANLAKRSKCRAKVFRKRNPPAASRRWGPEKKWETWEGRPDV